LRPSARAPVREDRTNRKYINCREFAGEAKCTIAISADSEEELIEAAVRRAVAFHGHQDTPEFRKEIVGAIRDGTPPMARKAA
jgi:predicted small metal-binding protein